MSKVSANSSVLSYKSKIVTIYCDFQKVGTFFSLNIPLGLWKDSIFLESIL